MPSRVTLTRDEFGKDLWNKVGELLSILTHAGYMCKVYDDEVGLNIVVIEYDYADPEMRTYDLVWVDEVNEYVAAYADESEDED